MAMRRKWAHSARSEFILDCRYSGMTFVLRIVPEDVSSWHQTDLPPQFPHVRYRGVVSTGRRNTLSYRRDRVCCDGSKISSGVYCGRENGVVGSLEARRVAEGDRTSFW